MYSKSIDFIPPTGNQPVVAAKSTMRRAKKTSGMESPMKDTNEADLSTQVSCLTALTIPSGIERPHAKSAADKARIKVLNIRTFMRVNTGT